MKRETWRLKNSQCTFCRGGITRTLDFRTVRCQNEPELIGFVNIPNRLEGNVVLRALRKKSLAEFTNMNHQERPNAKNKIMRTRLIWIVVFYLFKFLLWFTSLQYQPVVLYVCAKYKFSIMIASHASSRYAGIRRPTSPTWLWFDRFTLLFIVDIVYLNIITSSSNEIRNLFLM